MRKLSLCITFIGMAMIIGIIIFTSPMEIHSNSDIQELKANTKVSISGNVSELRINEGYLIMKINDVRMVCNHCDGDYSGKEVFVEGFVTQYGKNKEIIALKVNTKS